MKALFVVEPNFLSVHEGVRRVILYYIGALEDQGYLVELGTPAQGQIYPLFLQDTMDGAAWSDLGNTSPLSLVKEPLNTSDFESIVITTPWVVARGLPALPGCIGLVYDLVPNLISAGCLRFSNQVGIYQFAYEHDLGFRYYLKHARLISCISESTRKDFLELYHPDRPDLEVTCNIPFVCSPEEAVDPTGATVLLVNALDMRKNLRNLPAILAKARKDTEFKVVVVAKERVPKPRVQEFFQALTRANIEFEWHKEIDDALLLEQYRKSTVLLFPSLYEGLGLPILEAQQAGVPAISSNISSCPEINMNVDLSFDPDDIDGMSQALVGILDKSRPCLRGEPLRLALTSHLESLTQPLKMFQHSGITD